MWNENQSKNFLQSWNYNVGKYQWVSCNLQMIHTIIALILCVSISNWSTFFEKKEVDCWMTFFPLLLWRISIFYRKKYFAAIFCKNTTYFFRQKMHFRSADGRHAASGQPCQRPALTSWQISRAKDCFQDLIWFSFVGHYYFARGFILFQLIFIFGDNFMSQMNWRCRFLPLDHIRFNFSCQSAFLKYDTNSTSWL